VIRRGELWWADLGAPQGSASGLPKDSVVNVSQVVTLDKGDLDARLGALDRPTIRRVEAGLRLVLAL